MATRASGPTGKASALLANLPVRTKLIAVLALPVVVILLIVGAQLSSGRTVSASMSRLDDITRVSTSGLGLVNELQTERDFAVGTVAGQSGTAETQLRTARDKVDQTLGGFRAEVATLDRQLYRPALQQQLGDAERRLRDDLTITRAAVLNRRIDATATADAYGVLIKSILDFATEVPAESTDAAITRDLTTIVSLSRAKEATAQERSVVFGSLVAGRGQPGDAERLITITRDAQAWNAQLLTFATAAQRQQIATALAAPGVRRAEDVRRATLPPNGRVRAGIQPDQWLTAMKAIVDRYRLIEVTLNGQTRRSILDTRATGTRRTLTSVALLLLVLVVSAGFSLAMSQSMVRALERLRETATDVANRQLPLVVERLGRGEDVAAGPNGTALPGARASDQRARDEIGELAETFGAVYSVAVGVAGEQAALRRSVGDMFVNFARRSQKLIDQQLELIGELIAGRRGRASTDGLSRLEHLATRMRRNAEDLIVLSGTSQHRRWSEPIPLERVVRTALEEVEHHTRVELLELDELGVAGHAAGDVAHLLAELVENAIAFSPPDTPVRVAGQMVTRGYVLEIEDSGIGVSDKELLRCNEQLANPADVDLGLSSRLGLFVISRLAARHGIRVQLRHGLSDGVVALVLLPDHLVTLSEDAEVPAPAAAANGARAVRGALAAPPRATPRTTFGRGHSPGQPSGAGSVPLPERIDGTVFGSPAGPAGESPARPTGPRPGRAQRSSGDLPRRIPKVNLAARITPPRGPLDEGAAESRSPENVRRLLSRYRTGVERGREEALADEPPADGATRPEELL
jgi:HAMP domain-containing protein